MMRSFRPGFRLTHLPTGRSVARETRRPNNPAEVAAAKRHLWSLVLHTPGPPRPARSYHLDPPAGVEPYIKQGDRKLAVGAEAVRAVLGGERLACLTGDLAE